MKLSALFSNHMVLQQKKPIYIWGEGHGKVCVELDGKLMYSISQGGKWSVVFPPMNAGGPYTITATDAESSIAVSDVMVGEVWIASGQSNMEQITYMTEGGFERAAKASSPNIRFFTVPRRTEPEFRGYRWHFEGVAAIDTEWQLCTEETALHFSAIGFYFAELLEKAEGVAVGIISCNYGGSRIEAWIKKERIFANPAFSDITELCNEAVKKIDFDEYEKQYAEYSEKMNAECRAADAMAQVEKLGIHDFARTSPINWPQEPPMGPHWYSWPGVMYENMILRIAPFSVSGVLWYQGEGNSPEFGNYCELFSEMVRLWRQEWNDNIPFLTVQIAPFGHWCDEIWPQLIRQQIAAANTIDGVYIVTSSDIGEKDNIHPLNKQVIGERLFLAAENAVFNKNIEYCGPIFSGVRRVGNRLHVSFKHAGSGLACDGDVNELMIAADDGKYVPAKSQIRGDILIAWSDEIICPVEVKMGFKNFCQINLYNGDGFIAAPFWSGRIE